MGYRVGAWLFVLVGLVACGAETEKPSSGATPGTNEEPPLGPWVSGERVRARLAVAEDGFATLVGWRDTELGLDCWSTETEPCGALPASEQPFFLDQECTQAAVWIDIAAPSQGYAQRLEEGTLHLYRIADDPVTMPFLSESGNCIASDGLERVYPVLEEVRFDVLAAWQRTDELGGGIDALATDDGALHIFSVGATEAPAADEASTRLRLITQETSRVRAAFGIFDSARAQECTVTETVDGLRCVPPQSVYLTLTLYRDSLCEERVSASTEPGSRWILENHVGPNLQSIEAYEVLGAGQLYSDASGSCAPVEPHYIAEQIPLSDFERLDLTVE